MTPQRLDEILSKATRLKIAIVGEVFLDKYLDIDRGLSEVSLETGREAHQVVNIRTYPGSGGSVGQKLAALGVSWVPTLSVIGEDGEGYDLKKALRRDGMDPSWLVETPARRTGTYTKPMMHEPGKEPYELDRLDIRNHKPLEGELEDRVIATLAEHIDSLDAVVVVDMVPQRNWGVVTDRVRKWICDFAGRHAGKVWFADSRQRAGEFRNVIVKPNQKELAHALGREEKALDGLDALAAAAEELRRRTGRPVVVTRGAQGLLAVDGKGHKTIPGFQVTGPIDICGAGDSVTAGAVTALAAGATLEEAALLGNLVASITIQQLGVTGTATPEQLRERLQEYNKQHAL